MRPSRALVFMSIALGAACDLALGITDVPRPDDASVADGAPDVQFDGLVKPDGAFDGCNGGAEDCSNGLDDNCNGLIDCEDPVCQGAGYACTPPVPAGWSGPIAFAAAAGGNFPTACSGNYGVVGPSGHDGLTASPASCTCTCPSQSSGASCSNPILQDYAGGNGCNSVVTQTIPLPTGSCQSFGQAASTFIEAGVFSTGSCTPTSNTKNVPPLGYANSYVACGYAGPSDDGGCGTGVCVQKPSSQFDQATCIYQSGDVACPQTAYTKKTLVYSSTSDTRSCSACSCTPSGGGCAWTLIACTDNGCTTNCASAFANDSCQGGSDQWQSAEVTNATTTPAACNANGGTPTGSASLGGQVTVCCP